MSSSDQAKSKLLDSMRMSKQGSSETPVAAKPAPTQATPAKKVKEAAPKKPKAVAAKTSAPKKPITDNFQAAQRVWPD